MKKYIICDESLTNIQPGNVFWATIEIVDENQAICLLKLKEFVLPDKCPDCGNALEPDEERSTPYSGELAPEDVHPLHLVFWCETCEQAFDGTGVKL